MKTKHQNIPIESLVQKDDHVIIPIKEKLVKMITKNNMKFKERREDTIAHVVQLEFLTQKKACLQKEITHQGVAWRIYPKKTLDQFVKVVENCAIKKIQRTLEREALAKQTITNKEGEMKIQHEFIYFWSKKSKKNLH